MAANLWILALHLIGLFFWVGTLLVLSRLLAFHAGQPEHSQALLSFMRRLYLRATMPGGALVLVTGLLMLHGVGSQLGGPGAALKHYLSPRLEDGAPSFWYVTFHVKLVCVFLLFLCDLYLYRQLGHLARSTQPKSGWPLAALMGVVATIAGLLAVWLPLGALDLPMPRRIGYAVGLPAGAIALGLGLKLPPGRARFAALHGCIAVLMVLILVLIVAKPFAGGVPV